METIASLSKESPSDNEGTITFDAAIRHLPALDDESARLLWIVDCLHHLSADILLPALKEESERYLNIDPYVALRFAETLVSAGASINRPDLSALGVMATGDAFRVLGRFQESVAAMDRAAEIYSELGDEVGCARTRNGWLWSAHRLGRGEAALMAADQAYEILVKHQVWARAATLKFSTAYVCSELGRYEEALTRYDRAQAIYDSLGESVEIQSALLKTNKAILLTQLADFEAALQLFEETRPVYARHGHTGSLLRREEWVAYVYAAQGQYTQALWRYGSILAEMERAGLGLDATDVALNMVECYLNLNRDGDALELAEETIRGFERFGTLTEAAKARFYCALAHAHLGNNERALLLLDEAAQAFAAAGLATQRALVTLQRAILYLHDENWSAASEEAERAGAVFANLGLVIRQAQADLVRARAAVGQGDYETAARLARSALAASNDRDVRWLAHEGYHVLGNVAYAQGDLDAALDAYRAAVTSIERIQSSLAIELRANFLADKIEIYEDTIAVSLRLGKPELAFAYLERAKSRALVDYLANNLEVQIRAREGADKDLLDALMRLREEHNWFYNRLSRYGLTEFDEGPALTEETLRVAIREREKQIARLLERLALDRTEGLAVASSHISEEHPSLPSLDPGTVLLEYYFNDDGGTIFVVLPGGLTVVPLIARPAEIRRLLHQWNLNLATTAQAIASNASVDGLGRNARGILSALYRALISPVAAYLAGCARVIIVPYGPTHSVPFHALLDKEQYLFEAIEISVCPSSSLLGLYAERPHRADASALVMAYTDGGRLPAVLAEARAVAALVPGECYVEEEATRATLASAAARHRVLHLAAHGEARLDNPTFAHLQLADGQLGMSDIFNLPLKGALVTLSACETGQSVVTGGDELIGLSRGFLYAGAATLVQSLWRVEDNSTAELMRHFYAGIRNGQPKGAALREAQRILLSTNGGHPYYWAPFQLVGDPGPL